MVSFIATKADALSTRMLWWLPRLAFVSFIAVVVALLLYAERSNKQEQRETLLSDMLWLEQNLHFQLSHNEDLLARLEPVRWSNPGQFEIHAQALLNNNSGLAHVLWLNTKHQLAGSAPLPLASFVKTRTTEQLPSAATAHLAESLGRPVYSAPYLDQSGEHVFEVHVPLFRNGEYFGTALGIYSLRALLDDAVPWWLTERYRISIADSTGAILVQRSKLPHVVSGAEYQIPFEPPGQGLVLRADPFAVPTSLASRVLTAALVFLALAVLGSFWALRRHVHGRLLAESALRSEVTFRKAMEDSLHTGLRARDLNGCITYVNPAFCHMVGWSVDELVGQAPPMPYWVPELMAETEAIHRRVLDGDPPNEGYEIRFRRRSGELFDVLIHEAPLRNQHGQQTGWMGSVVDITERKRAADSARQQEARLQATSRLVTMGEMASSLAHELNQPLAAISSYITGCRNLIATGSDALTDIDGALAKGQDQAQRAGRIIRRIYEFVRRNEPKSEPCDIEALVADQISLLEADAKRQGVRITVPPASTPLEANGLPGIPIPLLMADRVLLGQAVLNLVKNGIEAMRQTPPAERELLVQLSADANLVHLVVADRGCGISDEAASHLFEPFYTTKAEGLGVGLNICRSVIEAHRGRLWHQPNPKGGSEFHVRLPIPTGDFA
jgi:two-component system sensor histidine kinase DctS